MFQQVLTALDPLSLNDGLVTVESSKYGKFEGVVELDHLAEIGWFLPGHDKEEHIKLLYEPISRMLARQRL